MGDYLALLPEIFLCIAALIILIIDLFIDDDKKVYLGWLSLTAAIGALIVLEFANIPKAYLWHGMFVSDSYSLFFRQLLLIASALSILVSLTFIKERTKYKGEYFVIVLFATLGMMLLSAAADLVSIFVSLELTALSFYILASFFKDSAESNEAGLKYFILGAISSTIMVYGMSIIFGMTGSTELANFSVLSETAKSNLPLLSISLLFIVVGMGFKVAAAPFHMWAPDVYQGAPTPITAFLSVGSKAAGFAMFMRMFIWAFSSISPAIIMPLAILSIATMLVGNLIAIPQRNLKRFLAYSSIAQAGTALMAMAMGTELGIQSTLFYLLAYVFSNIGVFAVVIIASNKTGDDSFEAFAGLGRRSPFLGLAVAICLLSLAGIPLLSGFIGKFYIFAAVVEKDMIWMAVIGLLNSTIALYYYLNVLREVFITEPLTDEPLEISPSLMASVQICIFAVLVMGLWPAPFLEFARTAASSLF